MPDRSAQCQKDDMSRFRNPLQYDTMLYIQGFGSHVPFLLSSKLVPPLMTISYFGIERLTSLIPLSKIQMTLEFERIILPPPT